MFAAGLKDTLDKIVEGILNTIAERTFYFIVIVVCGVVLIVILFIYSKLKPFIVRKKEIEKLFQKLSVANNLNKTEQTILRETAKFHNIENLNILFLKTSLIEKYAGENETAKSLISKLRT